MTIAIDPGRGHVPHRPPWMRPRAAETDSALPFVMVVLLTVGATALLLSSQMLDITVPRSLIPKARSTALSRPIQDAPPATALVAAAATEGPTESPAVAPPAPVAEAATPAPEPLALDVGAQARVANTDGLGVVFSSAPRDGSRLPAGLVEGTNVTIVERAGEDWARVQSDGNKAGWVRTAYLAPAD